MLSTEADEATAEQADADPSYVPDGAQHVLDPCRWVVGDPEEDLHRHLCHEGADEQAQDREQPLEQTPVARVRVEPRAFWPRSGLLGQKVVRSRLGDGCRSGLGHGSGSRLGRRLRNDHHRGGRPDRVEDRLKLSDFLVQRRAIVFDALQDSRRTDANIGFGDSQSERLGLYGRDPLPDLLGGCHQHSAGLRKLLDVTNAHF